MRKALLFSLMALVATAANGQTTGTTAPRQTPAPATAPPRPAPATPAPAPAPAPARPRTTPRAAAPAAGRSGMAISVTDMRGRSLTGVHVEAMGPTPRMGESDMAGQVNFPGLQAGTYRLRFSSDDVTPFEREVTLRAGQVESLDIALSAAPPPREVPAPAAAAAAPAAAAAAMGPAGQVQNFSIVDALEKDFVGKQPRRETLLSCSGNLRTTMIQLNDAQPERLYSNAEAMYYVLGGEGTAKVNGRDLKLGTNGFVSVPRGTTHSFRKAGSRALVMLAVLSGEPCEAAK